MNTVGLSVVIPCLNQVRFIDDTLRSICDQPDKCVEIIVIDGGSTDGTLDVIQKYRGRITHFVSEPDKGHYDAVNKGMALTSGDILCWLNADDMAVANAYGVVCDIFREQPEVDAIVKANRAQTLAV